MNWKATMIGAAILLGACSSGGNARQADTSEASSDEAAVATVATFDADSAYRFVKTLVDFGPRVPNTEAHRMAGDWLAGRLRAYGWLVTEQTADLKAFDGTTLKARNIFAQINPEATERVLLLSHWDCRPWADNDPDPAKRKLPVDGANDGASGVGVLLEMARQISMNPTDKGLDILFVDAEDWGTEGDDGSWALGTAYFAKNPPVEGYRPSAAILLDMVGAADARFGYEYFSQKSNPQMLRDIWSVAESLGHGDLFHRGFGGAVTDDHVKLIEAGIPAIDIIDYRTSPSYQGFDPVWHTTADTLPNISARILAAVGTTLLHYLR